MRRRRLLFVVCSAVIVSTGPVRRARGADGDIEATAYGGESHGGWICGPVGHVAYGGAATHVRVTGRNAYAQDGQGWTVDAAGSVEAQRVTVEPGDGRDSKSGPYLAGMLPAARVRGGYEGKFVAVEGGAGTYESWADPSSDSGRKLAVYPEFEARIGPAGARRVQAVVGAGSPLVTTVQRPGLYAGASFDEKDGFGMDARAGIYRSGPASFDEAAWRGDVVARVPVTSGVRIRLGAGAGRIGDATNWETSAGMQTSFK